MTQLHTNLEYAIAVQTLAKFEIQLNSVGLSERDQHAYNELRERVGNYQDEHQIKPII